MGQARQGQNAFSQIYAIGSKLVFTYTGCTSYVTEQIQAVATHLTLDVVHTAWACWQKDGGVALAVAQCCKEAGNVSRTLLIKRT